VHVVVRRSENKRKMLNVRVPKLPFESFLILAIV